MINQLINWVGSPFDHLGHLGHLEHLDHLDQLDPLDHLVHLDLDQPHNPPPPQNNQIGKREVLGPPTSSITMASLFNAIPPATLIVKMDIQVFISLKTRHSLDLCDKGTMPELEMT